MSPLKRRPGDANLQLFVPLDPTFPSTPPSGLGLSADTRGRRQIGVGAGLLCGPFSYGGPARCSGCRPLVGGVSTVPSDLRMAGIVAMSVES